MKVKCLNCNIDDYTSLYISKIYDIIDDEICYDFTVDVNGNKIYYDAFCYLIVNEYNRKRYYPKKYFKTLSEIRNEKIDRILK